MSKPYPILCLLLLLTGCGKYSRNFELNEQSFGSDTIQMIERDSRITLPAGAHGLNFFYKAPIDPGFSAKIWIPSEAKTDLMAQLSKLKAEEIHVASPLGSRFKCWAPAQAKVLIERQEMRTEGYLHTILTEEGDRIVFYLEWYTR